MGRKRLQQKGDLYIRGGQWKLRWREDAVDITAPDPAKTPRKWSASVTIGPAAGKDRLTEKQAARIAWENHLSQQDQNSQTPKSVATLEQFVKLKYEPEHIVHKKKSTRRMYKSLLDKHILKHLGSMRLRDVKRDNVQRLIAVMLNEGLSPQTIKHAKNIISSIFNLAEDCEWSKGNPARSVRIPAIEPCGRRSLTPDELARLLGELKEPYRAIVKILAHTGLRIGELLGLRWKYVNLASHPIIVNSEFIPAHAIAVREQFTAGEWATLKTRGSKRDIPMTSTVWLEFAQIFEYGVSDLESVVFPNREGNPLCANNIANRHFNEAAERAGVPWATLHCLRYNAATLTNAAGMTMSDRMKFLGHNSADMTNRYTTADIEAVRQQLEKSESGRIQ